MTSSSPADYISLPSSSDVANATTTTTTTTTSASPNHHPENQHHPNSNNNTKKRKFRSPLASKYQSFEADALSSPFVNSIVTDDSSLMSASSSLGSPQMQHRRGRNDSSFISLEEESSLSVVREIPRGTRMASPRSSLGDSLQIDDEKIPELILTGASPPGGNRSFSPHHVSQRGGGARRNQPMDFFGAPTGQGRDAFMPSGEPSLEDLLSGLASSSSPNHAPPSPFDSPWFQLMNRSLTTALYVYNKRNQIANASILGMLLTQYYKKPVDRFMARRIFLLRWMYSLLRGGMFVFVLLKLIPLFFSWYMRWKRWSDSKRKFTSRDFINKPI